MLATVSVALRLAIFTIAAAAAVFAAIALTGDNADAQGSGQVKSLSVGGGHVCALTETNEMICWGRNDFGQADAQPMSLGTVAVEVGKDYSCVTHNADLYRQEAEMNTGWNCWGNLDNANQRIWSDDGNAGQDDDLSTVNDAEWYPEAMGINHRCGWFYDPDYFRGGTRQYSTCWGDNSYGQIPFVLTNDMATGGWHTCYTSVEAVECVGRNDSGQTDIPIDLYLSFDAGREHTCAVTIEGGEGSNRLRCWGKDDLGQSSPPSGSDYLEISSNGFANFNCALTNARKVRCWGDNQYGQLNVPAAIAAPPLLEFTETIDAIFIYSRQNQPIIPVVFPAATGGEGRLSYRVGDLGQREPPTGLVFDETTRTLSGSPSVTAGLYTSLYHVWDPKGRNARIDVVLWVNGPVPTDYAPAISTPELGTLDRGLIRCGVWSEENLTFQSGGAYELYNFDLASPTQLIFNLESEAADTHLLIFGPDEQWHNYDDDDQRIDFPLTLDLIPAQYQIYVYPANDQGHGAYTLRISSPDFAAGNADAERSCPGGSASQGTSAADDESTSAADDEEDTGSATLGRIEARRLDDGRIEFAWHVEDGDRVLPSLRYLPAEPPTGRWLRSSEIIVEGVNLGRINVRVDAETGRIEFAFTPAGGERILPQSRYFPSAATPGRWLRSTLIEPGG